MVIDLNIQTNIHIISCMSKGAIKLAACKKNKKCSKTSS